MIFKDNRSLRLAATGLYPELLAEAERRTRTEPRLKINLLRGVPRERLAQEFPRPKRWVQPTLPFEEAERLLEKKAATEKSLPRTGPHLKINLLRGVKKERLAEEFPRPKRWIQPPLPFEEEARAAKKKPEPEKPAAREKPAKPEEGVKPKPEAREEPRGVKRAEKEAPAAKETEKVVTKEKIVEKLRYIPYASSGGGSSAPASAAKKEEEERSGMSPVARIFILLLLVLIVLFLLFGMRG